MHLHLRDEARSSERRTPLVPDDVRKLLDAGWTVTVEASDKRIIENHDYQTIGCDIAAPGSWVKANPDTIILGLKELPSAPAQLPHRMIHFAHVFKEQFGWREELARFQRGGGCLYDIEYLVEENRRRTAAFGYWAGWMGAALALWRHLARDQDMNLPPTPLQSFDHRDTIETSIRALVRKAPRIPRCIVIGALGRSGSGAIDALSIAGCEITKWDMAETINLDHDTLLSHDLLVNCVLMTGPGLQLLTPDDLQRENTSIRTISDVSCDPMSDYNPLPVYQKPTSWEQPFLQIGRNGRGDTVELTAIDNLPSLIPLEASQDFSGQFVRSLLRFDHGHEWSAAKQTFESRSKEVF